MNVIRCKTAGCLNSFSTPHAVSKKASYQCAEHTPQKANESLAFQSVAFDPELSGHSDADDLLKFFAGEDLEDIRGFMSGFQIKNHREQERPVPEWAKTNEGIKKVLLTAFPGLRENTNVRARAIRWLQVIQLYFRMGWSFTDVAEEINEAPRIVEFIIRAITRASQGLRADGKGPRRRNMP
jgi:hypothetical protein